MWAPEPGPVGTAPAPEVVRPAAASAVEVAPAPPITAPPPEAVPAGSNGASGRHAGEGKKAGKFGLFGRKAGHVHEFELRGATGGIARRVCRICGQVSLEGRDVYEGW
jgi:hypothetical protein